MTTFMLSFVHDSITNAIIIIIYSNIQVHYIWLPVIWLPVVKELI